MSQVKERSVFFLWTLGFVTQGKENKLDTAMGKTFPELWVTCFFLFVVWGFFDWGFLLVCVVLLSFFEPLFEILGGCGNLSRVSILLLP